LGGQLFQLKLSSKYKGDALIKKLTGMIIVACVGLFPALSMATDVGGIIDADTIRDLAGSPYNIISTVQGAEGVTLTMNPV
jgi:hypothetical protein